MRPQNEWFHPEQLRRYYFAYEAIFLAIVLGVVGVFAITGILTEMQPWFLIVAGAVVLAAFGYLSWWIPAFYRTAEYRFTDDEIEYRRGVFFQQQTTVPYNRVTNVGVSQGPLQRLVNAGSVGIHTAGYGGQTGAELTIGGVSDFETIQAQILGKVRGRPAAAVASEASPDGVEAPDIHEGESGELLGELRRIRELLERDRTA